MPPKPKELTFEELKAYWYAKLAAEGFDDIEDSIGRLIQYSISLTRQVGRDKYYDHRGRQEYYRLASLAYYSNRFECSEDREVWKLHALRGLSRRNIAKELGLDPDRVKWVILRLAKRFGIWRHSR
jgi:hypothetical protein